MIKSNIKYNKKNKPIATQEIEIECDCCKSIEKRRLCNFIRDTGYKLDSNDPYKCRYCRQTKHPELNKEYLGTEILFELKRNKNGRIISTQKIKVKCSECEKIKEVQYSHHRRNRLKSKIDIYLCKKCSVTSKENIECLIQNSNNQRGKTYTDIYGDQKANDIKNRISSHRKGKKWEEIYGEQVAKSRRNYFKNEHSGIKHTNYGKTWEEIHGNGRAKELKEQMSNRFKGKNNHQWGKPPSKKSGNGWQGWYNGTYFRSILELSFIINVLEEKNLEWKSAEQKKYAIPYVTYDGKSRNYFPDFLIENNELVEIKPYNMLKTKNVQLKKDAAEKMCISKNMIYNIYTEKDFKKINMKTLQEKIKNNEIILSAKTQEKFNKHKERENV